MFLKPLFCKPSQTTEPQTRHETITQSRFEWPSFCRDCCSTDSSPSHPDADAGRGGHAARSPDLSYPVESRRSNPFAHPGVCIRTSLLVFKCAGFENCRLEQVTSLLCVRSNQRRLQPCPNAAPKACLPVLTKSLQD